MKVKRAFRKRKKKYLKLVIILMLFVANVSFLCLNFFIVREMKNLEEKKEKYQVTLKEIEEYQTLLSSSSALFEEFDRLEEEEANLQVKIDELTEENNSLTKEIENYEN